MKPLLKKLGLALLCTVIANSAIIGVAMFQERLLSHNCALIETAVFIVLQIAVIIIGVKKPLTETKHRVIYWLIAEALTVLTVWFWGFVVLGEPIWNRL